MTTRDDLGGLVRTCELCDGTGWTDATPTEAHRPNLCKGTPGREKGAGDCWCTASRPCRCTRGIRHRDVHTRILEQNAKDPR